jgi:WD40 repeat protein
LKLKLFHKFILIFIITAGSFTPGFGQFYNGHQLSFGKNRVQYIGKYWRYNRYEKFDTYYYKNGDSLSRTVARIAKDKIPELELFFGYGLQKRLIFLCFKSLSDFRESNVGYDSGNESTNIGGVTRIIDNKVLIYYEGDAKSLEKQISEGITQLMINDMLYGGSYTKKITNSTLIDLPEWYESGLISYISEEWSIGIENRVKDGFLSKKYKKINYLTDEDARFAGHSFWYFIGETYGKEVIPNIIYLTRINKNPDAGFRYVLGLSVKELSPLWRNFYEERYEQIKDNYTMPDKSNLLVKGKKKRVYNNLKISPDNKFIAYNINYSGRYFVTIFDKSSLKRKIIFKGGYRLDQITDYSYPILAWHPSGKILSFIIEEQGRLRMFFYNLDEKKMMRRTLMYFDKILSLDYSDDGFYMIFSAAKDGQNDLYLYNVGASNFDKITNDRFTESNPEFIEHSKKIIFSSDSINGLNNETDKQKDLFIFDISSQKLTAMSHSPYDNEMQPFELKNKSYLSLTDKTGIIERQVIDYDSTINFIDTAIHYRYFTDESVITNYPMNIEAYDVNKTDKEIAEILYQDNRYQIFSSEYLQQKIEHLPITNFKKQTQRKLQYTDSLKQIEFEKKQKQKILIDSLRKNPPANMLHPDSIPVDINNYIFESDRQLQYYLVHTVVDTVFTTDNDTAKHLPIYNYLTYFYTDFLMQQVDFELLNNSYQVFTGSAYYFNPGMNVFTKFGIYDLFEDYRITGGFRLGTDLNSFEYLLSLENIKYKLDRQYVYHRQTYVNQSVDSSGYYYFLWKMYSNELMYSLKYSFSQVASLKGTVSLRHDKAEFLSTDMATLAEPAQYQFFSGLKIEYVFDNVKSLGVNLYDGIRFKLFSEYYQEVDQGYTNLFTLGADIRFYKEIHRNLIFASRAAGGSSFGKSKLLYYLGGVDNWYVLNPTKMQFDYSVNINTKEQYVYQAVATNMRGFVQNARNGTNFFVLNNEIRFPVIRYLSNRPLNSAFLNNFQIIGFADAGSAWSGISPFDPANAYNTEIVKYGPVTVIIDKNRWPVIFGYGFGVRSKIFGYFARLDWAWGYDNYITLPRIFYFSLNLDF